MYMLYLDESGNENDANDKYFVIGGVAVFERTTFFLAKDVESVQQKHFPGVQPIPFHVTNIRAGKGFWRKVAKAKRDEVLTDLGTLIAESNSPGVVLFAAAVRKSADLFGEAAVRAATEEICRRFDLFLGRRHFDEGDTQRGLLIFSEGRYDQRSRVWIDGFRESGTKWGALHNLADIPYYANMKETRFLQLADYVANSVFLMYERGDVGQISTILSRFDQFEGILHGLAHVNSDRRVCPCPVCTSRRTPHLFGPWFSELEPADEGGAPDTDGP